MPRTTAARRAESLPEPFSFTAEEAEQTILKVRDHRRRVEAAIAAGEPVPEMRVFDPAVDEVPAGPPDREVRRPKVNPSSFTWAQARAAVAAADDARRRRRRRAEACPNCRAGASDG